MTDDAELRQQARKNLEARQGFWWFLVVFIVVNIFMNGIWYFTGQGYYWPGWVLAGTGIALVFTGVNAFTPFGGKITESRVDAEVRRLKGE